MAGETVKCEAICLRIIPWSRTSHVVTWLTPNGRLSTVVKGAVRPKSAFLGQYDLNYTCEIVYYATARGDLHALRECTPLNGREALRTRYRALLLAEHFRRIAYDLVPNGPDAADWMSTLGTALDRLTAADVRLLPELLAFELAALKLAGLNPELEAESGAFLLRGERTIPISREIAHCLKSPHVVQYQDVLLDAARALGVFYSFHLECAPDTRRIVLQVISTNEKRGMNDV